MRFATTVVQEPEAHRPARPSGRMAVARRGGADVVAGCVVHSDRGSQFRSRRFVHELDQHQLAGSMGRVGACLLTG